MSAYIAFVRKELLEYSRTYKLFTLVAVFLLFGFMNPITAKVMPEILDSLLPEGMNITLGAPTAFDSWAQFFKNISQMGTIVFVIVISGIFAGELSRGTLINMLTKGLSRKTVILSKFTAATAVWALSYVLCFGITYGYTAYFWSMEGVRNLFLSAFGLWVFGVLLIALLIFGGVLTGSIYGSLLVAGGTSVLMTLLNIIPAVQRFNPVTLSSGNMALLTAQRPVYDFTPALLVCAVMTSALIFVSIGLFNRKQV